MPCNMKEIRFFKLFAPLLLLQVAGCASVISSFTQGFAESLSEAILNNDDLQMVRDGAPSYLILVDSLVARSPDDAYMLQQSAMLHSAYAAAFVSALSLTPFRAILGDMHHSVPIVRRVGRAQLSCPVLGSTCGGPFVLAAACVSSR